MAVKQKADLGYAHVLREAASSSPMPSPARTALQLSTMRRPVRAGVDFDNNVAGIERATQLIVEICGGKPGPVDDVWRVSRAQAGDHARGARAPRSSACRFPGRDGGRFARLGLGASGRRIASW